jgi:hypothetical protein
MNYLHGLGAYVFSVFANASFSWICSCKLASALDILLALVAHMLLLLLVIIRKSL